jgi:hypothetical protein
MVMIRVGLYSLNAILFSIHIEGVLRVEGGELWVGPYPLHEIIRALSLHFLLAIVVGLIILAVLQVFCPNFMNYAIKNSTIRKHLYWIFVCWSLITHIAEDYMLGYF